MQGVYQVSSLYHKFKLKNQRRRRTFQKEGYNLEVQDPISSSKSNQYVTFVCTKFEVSSLSFLPYIDQHIVLSFLSLKVKFFSLNKVYPACVHSFLLWM